MGKVTGFKEFAREAAPYRDPATRILDFDEIYTPHADERLQTQARAAWTAACRSASRTTAARSTT